MNIGVAAIVVIESLSIDGQSLFTAPDLGISEP